jgi:hypothetical protein
MFIPQVLTYADGGMRLAWTVRQLRRAGWIALAFSLCALSGCGNAFPRTTHFGRYVSQLCNAIGRSSATGRGCGMTLRTACRSLGMANRARVKRERLRTSVQALMLVGHQFERKSHNREREDAMARSPVCRDVFRSVRTGPSSSRP